MLEVEIDKTIYSKKIAESLSSGNHPEEFATLFVTLLRQLVMGRPVSREALGTALGWSGQRVATVLEPAPGTEYDEQGNIIGLGLTLRETLTFLKWMAAVYTPGVRSTP